ncbi:hypothetical protein DJ62_4178 [Yersinia enterocolitica]|nr:hypothetical protein DJ62_4178 [Yersinia enterocolitica]
MAFPSAVLPWHKPDGGGEITAAGERLTIAYLRRQQTSSDSANSRDREQVLADLVGSQLLCRAAMGFIFRLNKTHGGARSGFTNGFGINKVVLVTFDKRTDKLGGTKLNQVTGLLNFTGHKMGVGTGLHHHSGDGTIGEELGKLLARKLFTQ